MFVAYMDEIIIRPFKLCLVCYDLFKCLQSDINNDLRKK